MIKKFNLDGATRQLQAYPATTWHISAHDFMVSSRAAPYLPGWFPSGAHLK